MDYQCSVACVLTWIIGLSIRSASGGMMFVGAWCCCLVDKIVLGIERGYHVRVTMQDCSDFIYDGDCLHRASIEETCC